MTEPGFSLTNQFLIAMPSLDDPNFHGTVTLICDHGGHGAMGLIINRPLDINLGEVLGHMHLSTKADDVAQRPVFMGGPVQNDRGFVLHTAGGEWDSTLRIGDTLQVTTSKDILADLAKGEGPQQTFIALGYAGWGAGQLEQELADNAWLCGPADLHIIFDTPWQHRWKAAAALMGVDLSQLSDQVGHA